MAQPVGSWSFVSSVDTSATPSAWRIDIVPGGFKYTATNDDACATLKRTASSGEPDIDVKEACGGTIPVGTCIVHTTGGMAAVVKP